MTILEMKDQKANLVKENDEIFAKIEAEKRSMTDDEKNKIQSNLNKSEEIDLMLGNEVRKGTDIKVKEVRAIAATEPKVEFSLLKAINDSIAHRSLDESATKIAKKAAEEFRNAGVRADGQIQLPSDIMEKRTVITAGTADHGAEVVAEDKLAILPPLVDRLVLAQAGAKFLTGLVGNVSIPAYAGTTAAWAAETYSASESNGTFSEVDFSPKRLTAVVDVSKLFLLQDSVGAEQLLYSNIQDAIARKLEATILGVDTHSATQPGGMAFGITKGATDAVVTPTRATIIAMETSVDSSNALAGNLGYITNSTGRGILKNIVEGPSGVGKFLLEGNEMNGYPVYVTNAAPANCGAGSTGNFLAFGNWADLCICQWGGYDITVDPYTIANAGQVRLVINAYFDAKGLRGAATSGSGYDDYATSFAKKAIKA